MSLNSLQPTDNEILSVADFTRRIKDLLEGNLAPGWIRGEISNLRRQSSGHIYFTLKDRQSQLSCALFRGDALRQRLDLRDGMQVVVYGEVSVYAPRGGYQYICRLILEDGLGRLQVEFDRLKRKLHAEGVFAAERKVALPRLPQTIGFITSPSGAAIRDFLSILQRRGWRGRIVVLPTKVQGAGAAEAIVHMLQVAETLGIFDVLVLGRGGGSLEDLWCFNEESVARAVAACTIPLISAVGHEIDFTLSDFAADVRAETPSAAAELITSGRIEVREQLRHLAERLMGHTHTELDECRRMLELTVNRLNAQSPKNKIEQAYVRLDDISGRLLATYQRRLSRLHIDFMTRSHRLSVASPARRLAEARQRLAYLSGQYQRLHQQVGKHERQKLQYLEKRLQGTSLQDVLRRGFVIVRDAQGNVVTRKAAIRKGQQLSNDFFDGEIAVKVMDA